MPTWDDYLKMTPEERVAAGYVLQHLPAVVDTRQAHSDYGKVFLDWQKLCMQRKAAIGGLHQIYKDRVAQRQFVLDDHAKLKKQWDAYVEDARNNWVRLKDTPPPPRPEKPDK